MKTLLKLIRDEEGATMAEYALLLGLVTVAIATVVGTFGGKLKSQFSAVENALGN